jgi:hypothetical protein
MHGWYSIALIACSTIEKRRTARNSKAKARGTTTSDLVFGTCKVLIFMFPLNYISNNNQL